MKSMWRMGLVAVLAAGALAGVPARAEYGDVCLDGAPSCAPNPFSWTFYGTVTDPLGRAVDGATVRSGIDYSARTLSAADGSYRLDYDGPVCCTYGNNQVVADKWPVMGGSAAYGGSVAGEDSRLDIVLRYYLDTDVTPRTAQPGDRPVFTFTAAIPEPTSACGFVERYDENSRQFVLTPLGAADAAPDGRAIWTLTDPEVPDDASRHDYRDITAWAEDCESRTRMTNYASDGYSIP